MKYNLFENYKILIFATLTCICITIFNIDARAQKIKIPKSKTNSISKPLVKFEADTFQIFNLINAERAKYSLGLMVWDDDLAIIARDYSERMAKENFFSHFDSNGQSVLERAKTAKIKHWSKIGENLFSCENVKSFDAFAVKNWMNSPTHRENIINPDWTATGIGIAQSKDGEIFITQVFIKR